jgi:hypothetical protein
MAQAQVTRSKHALTTFNLLNHRERGVAALITDPE